MEQEKTQKHPGGRPSKINSINLEKVKFLSLEGFTDKKIADFFDIDERTFNNLKKSKPEFFHSLKDWKKEADKEVEKSLYLRAKGYQHEEDKIFCENGKVTIVPTIKHYPPDPTAMIFWLKNRQPDVWRDKTEVEHSAPDSFLEKFASLTGKELLDKANGIVTGKTT
jgi:hypothetical protein